MVCGSNSNTHITMIANFSPPDYEICLLDRSPVMNALGEHDLLDRCQSGGLKYATTVKVFLTAVKIFIMIDAGFLTL